MKTRYTAEWPPWRVCWGLACAVVLGLNLSVAGEPAPTGEWKLEVLHLKNGRTVRGLVVNETSATISFENIRQNPGRPTVHIFTRYARDEVESIERLGAKEHEQLAARLKALDPEGEKKWEQALELKPAPWRDERSGALSYKSEHFLLISDAREDIVRRAAARLEQIYGAYTRFLPPRRPAGEPTTIRLVQSLQEYQDILRVEKQNLFNPGFYDPKRNQILCASDLERLGDDLQHVKEKHQHLLGELKKQEAELRRLFQGNPPPPLLREIFETRKRIAEVDRKNEEQFQKATKRLFQLLYHEAFHAYLANFVYPPSEADVPRWLNEGLAQIFETALVEAGELRVGHADADRLQRAKAAVRGGELVPLAELLKAGPRQFIVAHASDQRVSDRSYLTSWALAFYLLFDRRLLGTKKLDDYVHGLKHGSDPLESFRQLVGQPLPQFEKEFHQYLLNLQTDGSVKR
jgi:hypothetical protein